MPKRDSATTPSKPRAGSGAPGVAQTRASSAQLLREIGRQHLRAQRALIASRDIAVTHCTILSELSRHASLSVSALAARLRLDKGWVSRVTTQMIADGLVRQMAVEDQRVVALSVTKAGRLQYERTDRLLDEQMERVLGAVPRRAGSDVRLLLEQIAAGYEAELEALGSR